MSQAPDTTEATGRAEPAAAGDVPRKLGSRHYLGYAAGDAANNLTFSMVSAFLLIYYTDVAGIPAATAGTIFLVVRIWGGVSDLLAGGRVDKTNTRWGRFRPYLLFGSVPLLVSLVLLFTIPSGLSTGTKVVWAYVTYALFSLAYSFVNIPFGSLSAAMTQDPGERSRLASSRAIAASLTILLLSFIVSPQISRADDLQATLTITTIVFAVVGFGLYLLCFRSTFEKARPPTQQVTLRDTVRMLGRNKPLLILCGAALAFLTGMFSLQAVAVYYARDVLGNADLYIVLTLVQTVAMILASAALPKVVEALGKKKGFIAAGIVGAVASAGFALAPSSMPIAAFVAYFFLGFGLGMINTLIFAVQADTVDYGEWRSGIRAEGANYSVLSFTRKVGQGFGGAAGAYTIGLGGYISGAASQSGEAITSIRVAAGLLPGVLYLAAAAVMLAYPLTERRVVELVADMATRRAGEPSA